jgi:hypothetical protein
MNAERGSFGSASLHIGSDWQVRCSTYPDTPPILSVGGWHMEIAVSIADRQRVSAEAVAFAQELTRQAAVFAADCERLHAEQHGQACETGQQDAGRGAA